MCTCYFSVFEDNFRFHPVLLEQDKRRLQRKVKTLEGKVTDLTEELKRTSRPAMDLFPAVAAQPHRSKCPCCGKLLDKGAAYKGKFAKS